MILMSEDHVAAGLVVADHIVVGPVVAGHIEVGLCPIFKMYHTWPSSVQHIQGPLVTPHATLLCGALSMELAQVVRRECCQCSSLL